MKVLLDEGLPRRSGAQLTGYHVQTVPQVGWASIKNGNLLSLAEAEFDVFITVDRNLSFQQNLSGVNIAVVVLAAPSNRYQDLLPLAPKILSALGGVQREQIVMVGG